MKARLLEFLKAENKSSAQLAEDIGVQPSSISHILSGRNNPSLDFVLKMLEKYQFISTDWLLFGKGSMYRDIKLQTLFDEVSKDKAESDGPPAESRLPRSEMEFQNVQQTEKRLDTLINSGKSTSVVEKIVWFYDNNSFEEYYPRN